MRIKRQIWEKFKGNTFGRHCVLKLRVLIHLFSSFHSTDIRDSKISTVAEGGEINPLWTRSDNSFRFNFLTGGAPPPPDKTSAADHSKPPSASLSFTGQGSTFAFNFQIPPAEDMDTKETTNPSSLSNPQCIQEEEPSHLQGVGSAGGEQCKTKKKKKKSGKKKPSDAETQQKPTEGSQREEELVSKKSAGHAAA